MMNPFLHPLFLSFLFLVFCYATFGFTVNLVHFRKQFPREAFSRRITYIFPTRKGFLEQLVQYCFKHIGIEKAIIRKPVIGVVYAKRLRLLFV